MHFYALRIVCKSCKKSFLVGGSARNDLTRWRELMVRCHRCGAELRAATGTAVDLSPQPWDLQGQAGMPQRPGTNPTAG